MGILAESDGQFVIGGATFGRQFAKQSKIFAVHLG
jgi:hypothetical protein